MIEEISTWLLPGWHCAREECFREGAVAYLRKPPDERLLLDALVHDHSSHGI
jgi:CheY-like chemotaxis protein